MLGDGLVGLDQVVADDGLLELADLLFEDFVRFRIFLDAASARFEVMDLVRPVDVVVRLRALSQLLQKAIRGQRALVRDVVVAVDCLVVQLLDLADVAEI